MVVRRLDMVDIIFKFQKVHIIFKYISTFYARLGDSKENPQSEDFPYYLLS